MLQLTQRSPLDSKDIKVSNKQIVRNNARRCMNAIVCDEDLKYSSFK